MIEKDSKAYMYVVECAMAASMTTDVERRLKPTCRQRRQYTRPAYQLNSSEAFAKPEAMSASSSACRSLLCREKLAYITRKITVCF